MNPLVMSKPTKLITEYNFYLPGRKLGNFKVTVIEKVINPDNKYKTGRYS